MGAEGVGRTRSVWLVDATAAAVMAGLLEEFAAFHGLPPGVGIRRSAYKNHSCTDSEGTAAKDLPIKANQPANWARKKPNSTSNPATMTVATRRRIWKSLAGRTDARHHGSRKEQAAGAAAQMGHVVDVQPGAHNAGA